MMAWRRSGDKPLSEPVMVILPTHKCVTRPQWLIRCICRYWLQLLEIFANISYHLNEGESMYIQMIAMSCWIFTYTDCLTNPCMDCLEWKVVNFDKTIYCCESQRNCLIVGFSNRVHWFEWEPNTAFQNVHHLDWWSNYTVRARYFPKILITETYSLPIGALYEMPWVSLKCSLFPAFGIAMLLAVPCSFGTCYNGARPCMVECFTHQ